MVEGVGGGEEGGRGCGGVVGVGLMSEPGIAGIKGWVGFWSWYLLGKCVGLGCD